MNFTAPDPRFKKEGSTELPGNYHGGDPSGLRSDALDGTPGEGHYQDTGCHLQPSCLNCTLPQCYYDVPRNQARDTAIYKLVVEKKVMNQTVALEYNVSTRTVHRIVQKGRAR
jgi:hypothetical protein